MAERALKILGLSDERLAALGKPVVQQQSWKEKDRLLPVFTVAYQRRIEADVEPSHIFRFEIMGIVPGGFISEFHNSAFDEKFLQIQLPFDYKEKVQKHLETSTDKKKRAFSY